MCVCKYICVCVCLNKNIFKQLFTMRSAQSIWLENHKEDKVNAFKLFIKIEEIVQTLISAKRM